MKLLLPFLLIPSLSHALTCVEKDPTPPVLRVKIVNADYAVIDNGTEHLELGGIIRGGRTNFGIVITSYRRDTQFALVGVTDMNSTDVSTQWTLNMPGVADRMQLNCSERPE